MYTSASELGISAEQRAELIRKTERAEQIAMWIKRLDSPKQADRQAALQGLRWTLGMSMAEFGEWVKEALLKECGILLDEMKEAAE